MEKVRPEVLFEIEKKSRKEIIMKQTLLLKAKEIKCQMIIYAISLARSRKLKTGVHLAIKYESNGHISQIQPSYEYEMEVNKGGTNMNQVTLNWSASQRTRACKRWRQTKIRFYTSR